MKIVINVCYGGFGLSDEAYNFFTEKLWKMQTESIVVFPEGVAVLPWILCGGVEIGIETAKLMIKVRSKKFAG